MHDEAAHPSTPFTSPVKQLGDFFKQSVKEWVASINRGGFISMQVSSLRCPGVLIWAIGSNIAQQSLKGKGTGGGGANGKEILKYMDFGNGSGSSGEAEEGKEDKEFASLQPHQED